MRIILALLAATAFTPAFAADPPQIMPDVVVTATRVPTPVLDIPAGVTVIDRQAIETHGYDTLVQALSAVPGIHVSPNGGPGEIASVFVRGTESHHVLVLRDGMPVNDAADPSSAFNFGDDTLSDIERIEVIRGPMAALYGSGAIGGVINLISRRGHEPGLHLQGDLDGGYPAQVRGSVVASGEQGPLDYALTAESQSQRGYDYVPQRMANHTGTPQGYRDRIGTINLGYTPVAGTRLSLFLRARQAIYGFNNLGSPTFDNSNAQGTDDSLLGRVGIHSQLFGGTFETGLFLGGLRDDRHYSEPFDPRDVINLQSEDSRYHSYRADLQWNNTLHLNDFFQSSVLSATDLTFGYERTADAINVRVNSSFQGFPFSQAARASMLSDAVYAGLQSTLWQRLTLTGQLRQDWVADSTPTTWRFGAVFDAKEIATRFKAAYGTAFRAPSLFDRFGVDSFGYVGNPTLKPERAQGWEAGFTTTLPALSRPDFVSFGATYFNEQVTDLITSVFVPVDTQVNIGSAHIQGVEATLALHPAAWLRLQASYTFTDARNADSGARLLRRPQHSAAFDATITPIPRLTIAPELVFTGAFKDFLFDDSGTSTGLTGTSNQGLIANVTVSYELNPHMRLYVTGQNIFYSKFEPVNGYQTPGPNVLAGVRLQL